MPKPRGHAGSRGGVEFQVSPWHDKRHRAGAAPDAQHAQHGDTPAHVQVRYVPMLHKPASASSRAQTEPEPVLQPQPDIPWVMRSNQATGTATRGAGPSSQQPANSQPQAVEPECASTGAAASHDSPLQGLLSQGAREQAGSVKGGAHRYDTLPLPRSRQQDQQGSGGITGGAQRPRLSGRGEAGRAAGVPGARSCTLTWDDSDAELELGDDGGSHASPASSDNTQGEAGQLGEDEDASAQADASGGAVGRTAAASRPHVNLVEMQPAAEACAEPQARRHPSGQNDAGEGPAPDRAAEEHAVSSEASGSCAGFGRIARLPSGAVSGHLLVQGTHTAYGVMGTRVGSASSGCQGDEDAEVLRLVLINFRTGCKVVGLVVATGGDLARWAPATSGMLRRALGRILSAEEEEELNEVFVTYDAATLSDGPKAEAQLARWARQLVGHGAWVNTGPLAVTGLPPGFL